MHARYRNEALVEELIVARDAADAANRAKKVFLSSMSHELRTPMNAVLGFTQMLRLNPAEPATPRQTEYLETIENAGQHLMSIINQVLSLAEIETGAAKVDRIPVAPAALVDNSLSLVAQLARRHQVSVVNRVTEEAPAILGDALRLNQVLLNLLSNAIKYNRPGGTVIIDAARDDDGRLRISVRDDGIGIALDKQKELFQPFNRLGAEALNVEGAGIGLTISKQLVEMMEGAIGFESRPGVGSTFWVAFVVAKPNSSSSDI